jgi:hypothetical protein
MERPAAFAGKATLTEQEAAAFAKSEIERRSVDGRREGGADADVGRSYNDAWRNFGNTALTHTSLVVDPPDGRIPPLTPEAQKRLAAGGGRARRLPEGPEDRSISERCLVGFNAGPPMFPGNYNNNMQLVQTHDYVMILTEMVHEARLVPLDGRPYTNVRQRQGESRGRWEGDTLIVETKNFLGETAFPRSSANLDVIERFSLSGANTLLYQFTVTDPTTWTKPWTAELPMARTRDLIYEFACHEGNSALGGMLAGARAQEKAAEQVKVK